MSLLVDLFGYLSVLLNGLMLIAQSVALGGVLFLILLVRPLSPRLIRHGAGMARDTVRIAAIAAGALILFQAADLALQATVLQTTTGLGWATVLGADFLRFGAIEIAGAALLFGSLRIGGTRSPAALPIAAALLILAGEVLTTHAEARLDDRVPLLLAGALHQAGAAIWIGGLPSFIAALARCRGDPERIAVAARFSRMSVAGVGAIAGSGALMALLYVGAIDGFYGTAYGVMLDAKTLLFLGLLGLGGMNFLLVRKARAEPATPFLRLRRFAEAEIGIGFAVLLAASSLTSAPPAVDLTTDRLSWHEIVARNIPEWPRLTSPDLADLALFQLQARLDAEAAAHRTQAPEAFIPGSGALPPRNAADIAWSEYNHHWAGLFVLAGGLLALCGRAGARSGRYWPLSFVGLAVFLFFRSDPEAWPRGPIGLLDSLRDVEMLQHRLFMLLAGGFGLFEWRVETSGLLHTRWALVFPILMAASGALLLTHVHAIANVKEQLLIELTHTPLALLGIAAGWARWIELRTRPPESRVAGWIWPVCIALGGALLILYREA